MPIRVPLHPWSQLLEQWSCEATAQKGKIRWKAHERSPVSASVETEASQNPHLRLGKLSFRSVARRAG